MIGTVKPALALSLHTTDAALRAKLLPHAPHIAVEELVERAEAYARATHYPIQYQWTLIEGVNDSDAEVERIAQLLSGKYAIMNFIPFNEVDGLDYRRPSAERIAAMVHTLESARHSRPDARFGRTGDRRCMRAVAGAGSEGNVSRSSVRG